MRWHNKPPVNGRELTAEDVKYTYERFLDDPGQPQPRRRSRQIDKIEAVDRHTVRFTLKEPFAWFLDALASTSTWIIAREVVEQFGDLKRPESVHRHRPLDAGALRAERAHDLRAQPELLRARSAVRRRRRDHPSTPIPPRASRASLTGRYDFGPEYGMVVRRIDLDIAKQRKPGLGTRDYVVVFGGITWMKLDQEPFKDVRVRRALAMASNWREVLETNAWSQGHGVPNPAVPAALREWSIPIDQLPPEGRKLYEHDPREAKRLLAEAGLRNGLKVPIETTARLRPGLHGRGADRAEELEGGRRRGRA